MTTMVPFFLFYEVWGYLRADWITFASRTVDIWLSRGGPGEAPAVGALGATPLTVSTALAAFAAVLVWRRYRSSLPRWTGMLAVLSEMLWTYLFVMMLGDTFSSTYAWLQSRRFFTWFADLRGWLAECFAPAAMLWDGIGVTISGVVELVALPFAWVTIAGVVFGVALETARRRRIRRLGRAQNSFKRVQETWVNAPLTLRTAVSAAVRSLIDRVEPVWKAFGLMLRSGPLIVFGYVLAYTATLLGEQLLRWGIIRVLGPHDLRTFWQVADTVLFLVIPLIITPIQMALIASTYDVMLRHSSLGRKLQGRRKTEELRRQLGHLNIDAERPLGVGGKDKRNDQFERGG